MPPKTQTGGTMLGHKLSAEEIDLIRRTQVPDKCPEGLVEDVVRVLVHFAEHTGLDPLLRQCWAQVRQGKVSVQATIDGFRIVAGRSGEYEGQTAPEWCDKNGQWQSVWTDEKNPPVAARVGVYRKGFREPIYAPALYREYVQKKSGDYGGGPNTMWSKMPANQLQNCSESLALRKAFPEYLSGIYTDAEMGQAENDPDEGVQAVPAKAAPMPVTAAKPAPTPAPTQTAPGTPAPADAKAEGGAGQEAASGAEPPAQADKKAGPPPRPHSTASNRVAQILNPVRDAATRIGVEAATLGELFKSRFGHPTAQASVDEAMEFSRLALKAPSDPEAYVHFMRTAPRGTAA